MSVDKLSALAVRRTDLAVSERQRVLFLLNTMDNPWSTAYEFHYPLEMGIILRGRMRRIFSHHEVTLGPGQMWFCGMWEPHGYQVIKRPCHRAVVLIYPPMLAESRFEELPGCNWLQPFTVPPQDRPQATPEMRPALFDLVQRLSDANRDTGPYRPLRLRLLVHELLLLATRDWQPPSERRTSPPGDFDRVKQAIEAVFASRSRINTDEAARLCGLSRNRFSSVVQSVTGITFADFSLRFRLSGAARQLLCTEDPLKAVARDWGFNDESHLCRAFTLHYGVAPSQFRRQAQTAGDAVNSFKELI